MTSERRDQPLPSVAELAELDTGLADGVEVDEATAARLRAAAAADPRSAAILAGLAATRAELAAAATPPMPAGALDRWTAMVDAAAAAQATDHTPDRTAAPKARPVPLPRPAAGRTGRWFARPAVAAAALLVGVAVVVGISRAGSDGQGIAVSNVDLVAAAHAATGVRDAGGLDDPTRLAGCLRAAVPQVSPTAPLVGARRVVFEGRPGVLLVLGTGTLGSFAVAVVDPGCGPGGGPPLTFRTVP